ncbi:hypothetical protein AB4Z52_18925 [Rhizobium sp. 2YAF20]|uniref:hypothetical protein n=1 Tax=Rhizobium sp. 2YAF20 TaxID=3233027 RepID=UPI003F9D91C3
MIYAKTSKVISNSGEAHADSKLLDVVYYSVALPPPDFVDSQPVWRHSTVPFFRERQY